MKPIFHRIVTFIFFCLLALAPEVFAAPQKTPTKPTQPSKEENTPKLDFVKPYTIQINKSNQSLLLTDDQGTSTQTIPIGTYRKSIKIGPHSVLLSYGQGTDLRPMILLSSENDPALIHSLTAFGHTIQLGPRGAITITATQDFRMLEFTAGHIGKVTLDGQTLIAGNSLTALAGVAVKPSEKNPKAAPTISPDRRKAQVEALRHSTAISELTTVPTEPLPKTNPTSKSDSSPVEKTPTEPSPSTSEPTSVALDPVKIRQEIQAASHQNQALLQISQGLKLLVESLTNDAQDSAMRLQIPPSPPPRSIPETTGSKNEQAAKLQIILQEYLKDNARLAEVIQSLKNQLAPLQESRSNLEYSLRPEIPEEARSDSKLASQAFQEQRFDDAAEIYLKILKRFPKALHPLSNLGVTYFTAGKYKEAEKTLREALSIAPHDAFCYSILGVVLYQLQRPDEAWDALTLALALHPNDPQTHNYLSLVLVRKGLLEPAEREAREAIALNPNYSDAHYHLAVLYSSPEKPSKELARRHYFKSVELGGARDERLESSIGVPPTAESQPTIETNPK